MTDIPKIITCVDCGQNAHLMSFPPEEGWQAGDFVAYRCSGCYDRWDLVVEDPDATQASTSTPEAQMFVEYHRSKEQ